MTRAAAATDCPVTKTARILSDTWTMLIMRALLEEEKRFCELERALEGISTRTLARKLRTLEDEGMIGRDARGRYAATPKGRGLRPIERAMRAYGERYL